MKQEVNPKETSCAYAFEMWMKAAQAAHSLDELQREIERLRYVARSVCCVGLFCMLRWQRNIRDALPALAEPVGDVVQGQALVAANGELLVVMLPRGKDEELTSGTGFHAATAGLGKVGEAVLL